MFGYITVNQEELKIKDFRTYRSYYCGVCQELKEHHGQLSRFSLTYDMTFLAILLTGLYEGESLREMHRCLPHMVHRHPCIRNAYTAYAADMNVLLGYYDLKDDWEDDHNILGLTASAAMKSSLRKIRAAYPRQAKAVDTYMQRLKACEEADDQNLDLASGYTGELFGEIFAMKEDAFRDTLYRLGFQIGKFIYLSDAADDLQDDLKTDSYNPFRHLADQDRVQELMQQIRMMVAADAAREFEKLPIMEHLDILRNVLYTGIWCMSYNKEHRSLCGGKPVHPEKDHDPGKAGEP